MSQAGWGRHDVASPGPPAGGDRARRDEGPAPEEVPLRNHAALVAVFTVAFAGGLASARRAGVPLPERVPARDVILLGVATHKLSRLLTKERVTAFARAPFTEHQRRTGHGEVDERPRGRGMRRAIGELLTCPFCLGQWIAGGFTLLFLRAPRLARLVAVMFTVVTISDTLQIAYRAAERRA